MTTTAPANYVAHNVQTAQIHGPMVEAPPAPAEILVGDAGTTLSPDSLMAYCQSRLDSINNQVRASFAHQTRNASEASQIQKVANLFKNYSSADQSKPDITSDMQKSLQSAILGIQAADPNSAALPKLIGTYNTLVWSTTGDTSTYIPGYPADESSPKGDHLLSSTEIQGFGQTITDAANSLNSDSELRMIE